MAIGRLNTSIYTKGSRTSGTQNHRWIVLGSGNSSKPISPNRNAGVSEERLVVFFSSTATTYASCRIVRYANRAKHIAPNTDRLFEFVQISSNR